VIVDREVDGVLVGELVEHRQRVGGRFGDDVFETICFGELKDLARFLLVVLQRDHAVADRRDVGGLSFAISAARSASDML
jgi:hypothetical protein